MVDFQLVVQVVEQGGCEEQFLHSQDVGVALGEADQFFVCVAFDRVRDANLAAAEVGKDVVLDFLVGLRDILDLFLTLVLVAVHLQDTQDQIFVRNVRGAHGLFEAFPVLTFRLGTNGFVIQVQFLATQFAGHGLVGGLGAVHGKVLVQGNLTFRRRVRCGGHANHVHAVRRCSKGEQVLGGFPIFVAVLCALDGAALVAVVEGQVLHVRDDPLEVVRSDHKRFVGLDQVLGGHDPLREGDRAKLASLVALGARHAQLQAGVVLHLTDVGDGGRVVERFAVLPADHGAVAGGVFALEVDRLERHFTAFPHEVWGGFHGDLFREVLRREGSCDVDGDVVALKHDRRRSHLEVDLLHRFDHFGQAASREKHGCQKGRKNAHVCCEFSAKVTNSRTEISQPRPPCWRTCGGGC